jgi:hypothetical protein
MKISQIIYELIRDAFVYADVYLDFIDQDINLQSTTGIILIKDMTINSDGSKDLTSSTRMYESTYRIEVIGHKDAYMTLEALRDDIRLELIGYNDSVITLIDFARAYNDSNDIAEVKRFIQDFTIIYK